MLYQLSRHFYGRLGWIPCLLLLTCLPSLRHSIQLQQSKCIDSLLFSSKKMTKPRGMPLGLISSTLFLLGFQVRVLFTQHLYPDINVTGSLMYTNSREAHEFLGNIPLTAWLLSFSVAVSGIAAVLSSLYVSKDRVRTRRGNRWLFILFLVPALWSPVR